MSCVLKRLVPSVARACIHVLNDPHRRFPPHHEEFVFASIEILRISLIHQDFFMSTWPRVPEKMLRSISDVAFRSSDRITHTCVRVFTRMCDMINNANDTSPLLQKVRKDVRDFFQCDRFVNGLGARASHDVAVACLNFVRSFLSNTYMSDGILSSDNDLSSRMLLLNIQRNVIVSDLSRRQSAKNALETLCNKKHEFRRQPWSRFVSRLKLC